MSKSNQTSFLGAETDDSYKATHDPLTGLLNRRGLTDRLENLIENHSGQFAIIMVDLDKFKKVNDNEGHESGDAFLKRAASVFKETFRQDRQDDQDDIALGRTGGDEFVITLPSVNNEEDLKTIGGRLRKNLDETNIQASIGGAIHTPGTNQSQLLSLADQRMYKDKEQRKVEPYSWEQFERSLYLGALASEHGIDLSDVPALENSAVPSNRKH